MKNPLFLLNDSSCNEALTHYHKNSHQHSAQITPIVILSEGFNFCHLSFLPIEQRAKALFYHMPRLTVSLWHLVYFTEYKKWRAG